MTINDIKTMAELKATQIKKVLTACDQIQEAFKAFYGKSITGNKKRITDSMKAIMPELYTSIEKDNYFTRLKVSLLPDNRAFKTESGQWHYIRSDFFIIWDSNKDNIVCQEEIEADIERTKRDYTARLNRLQYTADNIEEIAKQAEQLKHALSTLQYNSDSELTEAFNIRF